MVMLYYDGGEKKKFFKPCIFSGSLVGGASLKPDFVAIVNATM